MVEIEAGAVGDFDVATGSVKAVGAVRIAGSIRGQARTADGRPVIAVAAGVIGIAVEGIVGHQTLAGISDAVSVRIRLIGVEYLRAVVDAVYYRVCIRVGAIGIRAVCHFNAIVEAVIIGIGVVGIGAVQQSFFSIVKTVAIFIGKPIYVNNSSKMLEISP